MEREILDRTEPEQTLILRVDNVEFEKAFNAEVRAISKDVQLPGFRRGKVPTHLIKSMHKDALMQDTAVKLANENLESILKEENINVVDEPVITDIKHLNDNVEITLKYECFPPFELADYKSLVVKEPFHAVTDEEVEEHIKILSYRYGKLQSSDVVEDLFYRLKVQMKESQQGENPPFFIDLYHRYFNDELFKDLVGKQVGYTVDLNQFNKPAQDDNEVQEDSHDHEHEHDHEHDHKSKEEEQTPKFLEILEIWKIIPAEIDEKFIKYITRKDLESYEDLKEYIGLQMQDLWDSKTKEIFEQNIIYTLINNNKIKVPTRFVMRTAIQNYEQQNGQDSFKSLQQDKQFEIFQNAQTSLAFQLIALKIAEAEKIELEEDDYADYIRSMKLPDMNDDSMREAIDLIKENGQYSDLIKVNKIMELLKDFATTEEISMPADFLRLSDEYITDFSEIDEDEINEDLFDEEEVFDEEEFDGEFFEDDDDDWDDDDEKWNDEEEIDEDEEWDDDDEDSSPKN
ncbi:MAG: trigger factor [Candidatus Kapaibacterium sp.]